MEVTIKFGVYGSYNANTDDIGMNTVGQIVSSSRCRATLNNPEDCTIYISGAQVPASQPVTDGMVVTLQQRQHSKS